MISDTLSDAAHEIRDYLRDMPETYEPIRPEIEGVLAVMDALRIRLDAPPPLPGQVAVNERPALEPGSHARAVAFLHRAIRAYGNAEDLDALYEMLARLEAPK